MAEQGPSGGEVFAKDWQGQNVAWCATLFADRPSLAALTYLGGELGREIPAVGLRRIVSRACEAFLTELAAVHRTYVTDLPKEWEAIYEAECIRRCTFWGGKAKSREAASGGNSTKTEFKRVKPRRKIVLPLPSGAGTQHRIRVS